MNKKASRILRVATLIASHTIVGLLVFLAMQSDTPVIVSDSETCNVATVPYHLAIRFENYEDKMIASDVENDIAYMSMDDKPKLTKGDSVVLDDGREFLVIDTCYTGFYIDDTVEPLVAGDSGSSVWLNDQIVGYISTNCGGGKVYCIWNI